MITPRDMKKVIIDELEATFPYPCYEFGVVEQMKYPCFFVRVTENAGIVTKNIYQHQYETEIVMMHGGKERGDESRVLSDIEKIRELFLCKMKVGERIVPIENYEMNYTGKRGNVPRITFDSPFYDSLYKKEDADMMEHVHIKEVVDNGNAKH